MPIPITCPGCHTRFQVSDKFAGQTGPCPKCKHTIRIPTKSEEVIIHAPENYGPKNAQGRAVLKPLARKDAKFSPVVLTIVIASTLLVVGVAFVVGRIIFTEQVPPLVLAIGALVMAPPLAYSAYTFLRNLELEPYKGGELAVRVAICSVVYAGLWIGYWYLKRGLTGGEPPELFHLVFIGPGLLTIGGLGSHASLDLEFGNAVLHCAFYVLVTSLLRLVMGLPAY